MKGPSFIQLAMAIVVGAYPLIVYFGLQAFPPSAIALLLAVILLTRLGLLRRGEKKLLLPLIGLFLLYALTCAITGSAKLLLYYPVLVNGVLATLFIGSLRSEALLLRFVRMRKIPMSAKAPAYLRRLTQVWAVFLVLNGTIALITVHMGMRAWVLYNGFIAYLAIGLLLGGELLFRRWYRRRLGLATTVDAGHSFGELTDPALLPAIVSATPRENGYRLRFNVHGELDWFDGHFPGRPILPGIVQLHWAILAARHHLDIDALPTAILRLKFRNVFVPPATMDLDLERTGNAVNFSYCWEDTEYSNGRIQFGT